DVKSLGGGFVALLRRIVVRDSVGNGTHVEASRCGGVASTTESLQFMSLCRHGPWRLTSLPAGKPAPASRARGGVGGGKGARGSGELYVHTVALLGVRHEHSVPHPAWRVASTRCAPDRLQLARSVGGLGEGTGSGALRRHLFCGCRGPL